MKILDGMKWVRRLIWIHRPSKHSLQFILYILRARNSVKFLNPIWISFQTVTIHTYTEVGRYLASHWLSERHETQSRSRAKLGRMDGTKYRVLGTRVTYPENFVRFCAPEKPVRAPKCIARPWWFRYIPFCSKCVMKAPLKPKSIFFKNRPHWPWSPSNKIH